MAENLLLEEICEDEVDSDIGSDDSKEGDMVKGSANKLIDHISDKTVKRLYSESKELFIGVTNQELTVLPQPLVMGDASHRQKKCCGSSIRDIK